jgi:2-polyprenyl-3-methyl-5-hydroxy-6-metoxy-1,4-benzoquinol methylase
VAVDISQEMLKHLHANKTKKVRADIQNVSFRRQFDRIICAGVLEFLDDISIFLANMEGALSNNGKMVLLLPREGICGFFYKFFHSLHGVKLKLFTKKELKSILDQGKWEMESLIVPTPMTYVLTVTNGK